MVVLSPLLLHWATLQHQTCKPSLTSSHVEQKEAELATYHHFFTAWNPLDHTEFNMEELNIEMSLVAAK